MKRDDIGNIRIGATLTLLSSQRDGYTTNSFTGNDVDSRESLFGRAQVILAPTEDGAVQVVVTLTTDSQTTTIDELQRTTTTNDTDPVPFVAQNVSETPEIYEDAALGRSPSLTPYADSARQHRYYLDALCDHLGLAGTSSEPCPIS